MAGEYRQVEFELSGRAGAKRPFFMEMEIEYGDYYAGRALKVESELFIDPTVLVNWSWAATSPMQTCRWVISRLGPLIWVFA